MGGTTAGEIRDRAVVTAVIPYGEADAIVRMMTRTLGRVGAFAKGARRGKKRGLARVMALSQGHTRLTRRSGSEFYRLIELDVTEDPTALGADPVRYGRAAYLVELTERLLPQAEPIPEYFDLLVQALTLLAQGEGDARLLRAFELKLLGHTGYLPELTCAPGMPEATHYDPQAGQLRTSAGPGTVPFGPAAQEAALLLCGADLARLPRVEAELLRPVSRIFALHLRKLGITELKTVAFLKALGT